MRFQTVATLAGIAALGAGCGGGGTDSKGPGKVKSEPQISLNELRACLKREGVPSVGKGGLSGKGIRGTIPLLAVGTDLATATDLLVLESADAAKRFIKHPPPAASFITPISRKGNVIKARTSQRPGAPSPEPPAEDAAIDRCLPNH